MLDWQTILTNGLWILGAALILAAVSSEDYIAWAEGAPWQVVLRRLLASWWTFAGVELLLAGIAVSLQSWPVQTTCVVLASGCLALRLAYGLQLGQKNVWVVASEGCPAEHVAGNGRVMRVLARRFGTWHLLVLVILTPPLLYINARWVWLLAALPLLALVKFTLTGRFFPRTPLDWPILGLLASVLASMVFTGEVVPGVGLVATLLLGICLYYALAQLTNAESRLRLAYGYALVGVLLAGAGLIGTGWQSKMPFLGDLTGRLPEWLTWLPGESSGFHPNIVAGALIWVVLPVGSLFAWTIAHRHAAVAGRVALGLVTFLTAATLVLTQSRGAILGVSLGILLLLWLAFPRIRAALLALCLSGAVLLLLVGPWGLAARTLDAAGPELGAAASPYNLEVRFQIWDSALHAIEDHPFSGIGIDMFRYVMPARYPAPLVPAGYDLPHAHNQLLQAAVDLGIPGLISYLSLWIGAALLALQGWRRLAPGWERAMLAGFSAALLASFAHGLLDAVVLVSKPGLLFWAMLGMLVVFAVGQAHEVRVPVSESENDLRLTTAVQLAPPPGIAAAVTSPPVAAQDLMFRSSTNIPIKGLNDAGPAKEQA